MPNVWMKHFALTYQSRMHEQRNNSVGKHMFLAEWLCISLYKRIPIRFHAKLYMGGYARQNTGVNTCPKQTPQFFLLNAFCPWGIVMDSILVRGRFGLFSQYIPIYSGSGISTYVIKSFIAAISRTRSQPRCIFQFLGSWRPLCPIPRLAWGTQVREKSGHKHELCDQSCTSSNSAFIWMVGR